MNQERSCSHNLGPFNGCDQGVDQANDYYSAMHHAAERCWAAENPAPAWSRLRRKWWSPVRARRRGRRRAGGSSSNFPTGQSSREDTWYGFLQGQQSRWLRGESLAPTTTKGKPELLQALVRFQTAVVHQRRWAPTLRNLENRLKAVEETCSENRQRIYQAENGAETLGRCRQPKVRGQYRAPKAVPCLETSLGALTALSDCLRHTGDGATLPRSSSGCSSKPGPARLLCAFTTWCDSERILYSAHLTNTAEQPGRRPDIGQLPVVASPARREQSSRSRRAA